MIDVSRLLTEQDISRDYGIALATLRGWRFRGGGPSFFKLGRSVRYRAEDVDAFLEAQRRRSTSDAGLDARTERVSAPPEAEKIALTIFERIAPGDPRGEWATVRAPLAALIRECGTDAVEEAASDVVAMIRRRERFRRGPLAHLIDEARRIAARRETRRNDGARASDAG